MYSELSLINHCPCVTFFKVFVDSEGQQIDELEEKHTCSCKI